MKQRLYLAQFSSVRGEVEEVMFSAGEVVVLGVPAEDDYHNCDAMGCARRHVLWRGRRLPGAAGGE